MAKTVLVIEKDSKRILTQFSINDESELPPSGSLVVINGLDYQLGEEFGTLSRKTDDSGIEIYATLSNRFN